jgi:hypothetical protein
MWGTTSEKKEATWETYDGRSIPISQLDDQHLSNCFWFSTVMWEEPHHLIIQEVEKRFGGKPLEWKPLPVPNEINWLRSLGMIHGTDIVYKGSKIGNISHLETKVLPI